MQGAQASKVESDSTRTAAREGKPYVPWFLGQWPEPGRCCGTLFDADQIFAGQLCLERVGAKVWCE